MDFWKLIEDDAMDFCKEFHRTDCMQRQLKNADLILSPARAHA